MLLTRTFDTEEQAWAFAEGLNYANDTAIRVEEVKQNERGSWDVSFQDDDIKED